MCFLSTTFPNAPASPPPILFDQSLTHVHSWTPNHGFSRSRQHVDDEPCVCSSVQLASATSDRSSSSHSSSMLRVRSEGSEQIRCNVINMDSYLSWQGLVKK